MVRRHILTIEKVDSGENALSFSRCLFVLEYIYFDGASQDLERCCQMRNRLAIGPNIDSITWPGVERLGKIPTQLIYTLYFFKSAYPSYPIYYIREPG